MVADHAAAGLCNQSIPFRNTRSETAGPRTADDRRFAHERFHIKRDDRIFPHIHFAGNVTPDYSKPAGKIMNVFSGCFNADTAIALQSFREFLRESFSGIQCDGKCFAEEFISAVIRNSAHGQFPFDFLF